MRGPFVGKRLSLKIGQTHVQRYLEPLMRKIEDGQIGPGALITHKIKLEDGPDAYKMFQKKTTAASRW